MRQIFWTMFVCYWFLSGALFVLLADMGIGYAAWYALVSPAVFLLVLLLLCWVDWDVVKDEIRKLGGGS